jgi:hypothetical protein
MRRVLAIAILVTSTIMLPTFPAMSQATPQAPPQCWYNGVVWNCGPGPDLGPLGLLALPFIAVGTAVTGVVALVTLPVQAIVGPVYYPPPPPAYYPPRYYYPPPPGSSSAPRGQ